MSSSITCKEFIYSHSFYLYKLRRIPNVLWFWQRLYKWYIKTWRIFRVFRNPLSHRFCCLLSIHIIPFTAYILIATAEHYPCGGSAVPNSGQDTVLLANVSWSPSISGILISVIPSIVFTSWSCLYWSHRYVIYSTYLNL